MRWVLVLAVAASGLGAHAQKPTPTPLMDSRGLPLPFGVQPYYKPDHAKLAWKRTVEFMGTHLKKR